MSLVINLLTLSLSIFSLQIYDRILVYHNLGTLNILFISVVIAALVEAGLRIMRSHAMNWAAAAFEHTVSANAVRHTLDLAGKGRARSIGDYLNTISSVAKIRDFYSGQALTTLIDLPFVFIFLWLIYVFAGPLVLAPLAVLCLMTALAIILGVRLKHELMRRNEADDNRYDFLINTLNGTHTIKAFGLETFFERRYETHQARSTEANFEVAALSAEVYDQSVISSHIMMIVVAVAGAPLLVSGQITLGALAACVMLSSRIMQPVQRAMAYWTRFQDIGLAHKKLSDHFQSPQSSPQITRQSIAPQTREGRIALSNVSFAYADGEKLLDNVTLSLAPGEVISISGEHGTGKQTLLKLVAGLFPPSSGTVEVDGINPHLYSSEELVSHIGYVSHDGVIFRGTVYENLSRFGRVGDERVKEMSELLGLDAEIAAMPAGYDTALEGGNSDALSPGLRQRIAIARVLASKPRVLLFYNADKALDKEGYNYVYRLMGRLRGRVTMVLVTNDHNIIHLADTHYELRKGQLISLGVGDDSKLYNILPYQEVRL
ncbi:MAG: ATP-binding cassette domain-containing protein [Asticcacaulis sp.]|uniref:peptidase domain-containing ABC transporter n=1 Tax=Asticcacaulis sp. TaxID=1872648 RepID=UPI0039E62722